MAHDPISGLLNEKYMDSLIIPVPSLNVGKINGQDIEVRKGYYKFPGEIIINKTELQVKLMVDNTDDHTTPEFEWNGKYPFRRL
jgi:hypothetical protein